MGEARDLWAQRYQGGLTTDVAWNLASIGAMARAQGVAEEAWALVHEGIPDGPQTEPGTTHFTAVDLQCLAARLALDEGDHALAEQWLEAHDRWFDWAGAEVCWGRANGRLAWAEYHHARGDSPAALQHAQQALAAAGSPRQPLVLIAAHRLLGELATEAGGYAAATTHLDASLALADACAAPYERALTLLARAELALATGDAAAARRLLTETHVLCTPLGALPTLARAAHLAARLARQAPAPLAYLAGLSVRQVEVLRLIASGSNNAQVAEMLMLSVRTVERHIENIYRKIDAHGRADATTFAVRHGLT